MQRRNAAEKTITEIVDVIGEALITYKPGDGEEISHGHQNGECLKTWNFKPTFEEQINASFDERMLNTPIEGLDLPVRAFNGLGNAGLETIKGIIDFGFRALMAEKNIGIKTVAAIKDAILDVRKLEADEIKEISFVDAVCGIISSITPGYSPIFKARLGFDGECKTLAAIGREIGVTRERVRQIVVKESGRMSCLKRKEPLQAIIGNLERLLSRYGGILGINDIAKDSYFIDATREQIRFAMNLMTHFSGGSHRIILDNFLTGLSDKKIRVLHTIFREAAWMCQFPINREKLFQEIMAVAGPISEDYLSYFLVQKEKAEISKEWFFSPRKPSKAGRIRFLLRDIDAPLHFSEIAERYRDYFGETTMHITKHERMIYNLLSFNYKAFIVVGYGTYMLREKFKIPDNIAAIVETSREILQELKIITNAEYLINELKRRGLNIGNLNKYSLKSVLLGYPGFAGYKRFGMGIDELADKYGRKSSSDLTYEVLSSIDNPLHIKEIWDQISKQRGFSIRTIQLKLRNKAKFVRTAPATYAVREKSIIKPERSFL